MNILLSDGDIITYLVSRGDLYIDTRSTTHVKWKWGIIKSRGSISQSYAKAVCVFEIRIALIHI